ncbi:hypothetical protein CALCODRAFT_496078 [Calocera cornea HHB12733]|uniref:Uncharacterized protein n=1 Tax=Calocera cornea HHB12733 TaxID=1353952 RepID=A0A165G3H8_9BASI|nr:hypothetical protein CALCODRAFT_496078 [Calocera cornea HHB12733]
MSSMTVVSPVRYDTNIPPRPARHPPTSPDSFRATPSSSPNIYGWNASDPLPYILAPDSRPASPSSQGRIDKLARQVRDHQVLELYLVCTKLRGPIGEGASRWGINTGVTEKYDEEDLTLPECEEHAAELERQKLERRAVKTAKAHEVDQPSLQQPDDDPQLSSSSRSTTLPVPTLGTPRATSTPAVKRKLTSQSAPSQTKIGFALSKPTVSRTQSKPSRKSSQTTAIVPERTTSRFFLAAFQDIPQTKHSQARSSQPTPFNSQFDVDRSAADLSRVLEEDAFDVDRGGADVVVISSDGD